MGIISDILAGVRSVRKTGGTKVAGDIELAGAVSQAGNVFTFGGGEPTLLFDKPLSAGRPTTGQIIVYNGTTWGPATPVQIKQDGDTFSWVGRNGSRWEVISADGAFHSHVLRLVAGNISRVAGSKTTGCEFKKHQAAYVVGAKFWWSNPSGSETIRVSLRKVGTPTPVLTEDFSVDDGVVLYDKTFTTPFLITGADIGAKFVLTIWQTAGTHYAQSAIVSPVANTVAGSSFDWVDMDRNAVGDAEPSAGGINAAVEPAFGGLA